MQVASPSSSQCRLPACSVRHHGLDSLRGIASVLVVLLHAGIPYMNKPMPFLLWPARDAHPSSTIDGLTWCIECFIMPLFFVLAGYFSNGVLIAQGAQRFLSGRTKRLLSTQFLAMVTILPLCLVVWSIGLMADGVYSPNGIMDFRMPPELEVDLMGVAHLWFLQNLYIYCVALCGVTYVATSMSRSKAVQKEGVPLKPTPVDRLFRCVAKPIYPAIPCALILYWDPRVVLGFYQSFAPVISKLLYYAVFFFVGAMLNRQIDQLKVYARFGKPYLMIAGILFAGLLPMIHEHISVAMSGWRLVVLASLLSLFAWFATFGLMAVFIKMKSGKTPVTQYLADASFWIYLVHLPLVALTHVAIAPLSIPTECKFIIAATTSLSLALMTYHVFVRDRWLGEFLKGCPRRTPSNVDPVEPLVAALPIPAPHYLDPDRVVPSKKSA